MISSLTTKYRQRSTTANQSKLRLNILSMINYRYHPTFYNDYLLTKQNISERNSFVRNEERRNESAEDPRQR